MKDQYHIKWMTKVNHSHMLLVEEILEWKTKGLVACTCNDYFEYVFLLTNQFTGAWTHYTDTVQGTRTDHMVESFQRISIE